MSTLRFPDSPGHKFHVSRSFLKDQTRRLVRFYREQNCECCPPSILALFPIGSFKPPLPLFSRKKGLSRYWTANYSRRRDRVSFEAGNIKDNPRESD